MRVLALCLVLLTPALAAAQETRPPREEIVGDLAYALGKSHALRQNCRGAEDQYWRRRMQHILDIETTDEGARTRLAERFNDGFRDARGRSPRCTADGRRAEQAAAVQGRALASLLTRATRPARADSVASSAQTR